MAITAGSALLASGEARAANGAYAVDAADISEVGSCKVESWISTASNTDFSAVANPSGGEHFQAGGTEPADQPLS